jgi:hypothetical protein
MFGKFLKSVGLDEIVNEFIDNNREEIESDQEGDRAK